MPKDKKTVIFGIGADFAILEDLIFETNDVCALMDNDEKKQGLMARGFKIRHPQELETIAYEDILITSSRYNEAIKKQLVEIGVPAAQIRILPAKLALIIKNLGDIAGKTVLDIGCGAGDEVRELAIKYSPHRIIGIDLKVSKSSASDNWLIKNGDATKLDFEADTFDAVYSRGAFEHIGDIKATLREVKRVLKPGGRFYCLFSHIWTSIQGYHDNGDPKLITAIPPWCHLYMPDNELASLFHDNGFDEILWMDYIKNHLNHYSRTELVGFIMQAGMQVINYAEQTRLQRYFGTSHASELTDEIRLKVAKAGYDIGDLAIAGIEFTLEKIN